MENSYEALYTGVYIFVFVAALTIALYLFQGVNDLADNAYDYGKAVDSSAVIETDTDVEYSEYLSKEDVISYYFNYIKKDNTSVAGMQNVTINGVNATNYGYLINNLNSNGITNYKIRQTGENSFVIENAD